MLDTEQINIQVNNESLLSRQACGERWINAEIINSQNNRENNLQVTTFIW